MISAEQKARLSPEQFEVAEWWDTRNEQLGRILQEMRFANTVEEINDKYEEYFSVHFCPHEHPLVEDCAACDEVFCLLHPERVCPVCSCLQDPDEMIESRLCPNCRTP